MPFVEVAKLSALRPGAVLEAVFGGGTYAVCNHGGEVHVFDGSCPCTGGPLGQGVIRDNLLVCPWHGIRFDPHTGVNAYNRNVALVQFPVRIDGDKILADLSEPG